MTGPAGVTTYTYYPNGKLRSVSHNSANALPGHAVPNYTLSYTYTLAGKPKTMTDAAGHVTHYHYDTQTGRLLNVTYQRA